MHWKGLWATFGHHGDVIDAFIPTKRSRRGRKFGFVRYASKMDADRAIARLNGFRLFGYRIEVSMAKFGGRTSYWRRVNRDQKTQATNQKIPVKTPVEQRVSMGGQSISEHTIWQEHSPQEEKARKKVTGHVEEETLWKLQSCLVGFTASENDSIRISDRLCCWGLGEIKVKKMAGRVFLLEIEDKQMYNSLKETGWSILQEIFTEICPWSESFRTPERTVWIELNGVPPHCWNHQTFKRIAEQWGELIFLGENALQSSGLESMTMVISTKQWERIESIIDLEVGKFKFPIRVSEIPPPRANLIVRQSIEKEKSRGIINDFQSESSSSTGRNSERDESSGDNIVGNGNDINSNDLGNINLSTDNQAPRDLDRQIGIMELQGSKTITRWADIVVKDCGAPTNQRMVNEPNTEHNNTVSGDKNPTDKIVDNEATIGLTSESLEPVSPEGIRHSFSPNWANSIDLINNKNSSARSKEERTQSHNEIESVSEAEEELQNLNKIDRLLKRRRDKKYGSMKEIQDRILNEADRKKRDRALRRIRKKEKNLNLEIGEASLSSSDLRKRRDILFRDAVKTLEFGKKVGFEAEGDSMQVIRDMVRLSENQV
ncbi:hypothetical protein GQ457_15G029650 [Hibiscus cannabinus]